MHTTTPGSYNGSFKSRMNFRPTSTQEDRGGTRPTPAPSSIGLILVTMVLHVCKKSLLFDARLKVAIYCGTIFVVSLIADFITVPRTYFSRSDNILNRYFVKQGWAWLLVTSVPWVSLTAYTLGCGRRSVLAKHLARLMVATLAWLLWTRFFLYVENTYGRCLYTKDATLQTKSKCLQAGKFWSGMDISGHAFILVYSNLILTEEGAALVGWEKIRDLVMHEQHSRSVPSEISSGPLKNLSDRDLELLKKAHGKFTPYLRALFVAMTLQQLLCDVMLVSTMVYYHIMIEKFLGAVAAILTWYVTYRWWYKSSKTLPSPGDGLFKYNDTRNHERIRRRNTMTNRFMGIPIKTYQDNGDSNASDYRS